MVTTREHRRDNGAGYRLSIYQTYRADRLDRRRRPVLIVPGYGMNSFIFSYHPRGVSLEGYLVDAGFEVWRVDLRGQGRSASIGGGLDYSLEDLALSDLTTAIDAVLSETEAEGVDRVDAIGASLGGTLLFIHAVLRHRHRLGSLVSVGSPVRWVKAHPLIRLLFSSRRLAGLVRFRGTRALAAKVLPRVLEETPWVLRIYMNPEITDTSAIREMIKTVEDPNRHVNRQIAKWLRHGDLVLRGVNISEALATVDRPLLGILANGDGVVPRETAQFPFLKVGSQVRTLIEVGTDEIALAHADMFISNEAHERVFLPIATWLRQQNACCREGAPEPR